MAQSDYDLKIIERQESSFLAVDTRRKVMEDLVRRHGLSREGPETEFSKTAITVLADTDSPDQETLIVDEELLVRSRDADEAAGHLKKAGIAVISGPDGVECRPGTHRLPIRRFRIARGDLVSAATILHGERIEASFNHVLPAGPVVKGQGTGPDKPAGGLTPPKVDPRSGHGVRVAVIDTGIAKDSKRIHTVLHDVEDVPENTDHLDTVAPRGLDYGGGHGTFVAGVVRQDAPAADVRVYRALDSDGIGSEVDVACAVVHAALEHGASVINLSLGQQSFRDRPPVAMSVALEMIPDDVVVIAAAGNDNSSRPSWPGAFRRVVAVGALSRDGTRARYSNYGSWVGVSTVGTGVISTFVRAEEEPGVPNHEDWSGDEHPIAIWSGTSFSAPQITGLVAAGVAPHGSARKAIDAVLASGWYTPTLGVTIESPLGL